MTTMELGAMYMIDCDLLYWEQNRSVLFWKLRVIETRWLKAVWKAQLVIGAESDFVLETCTLHTTIYIEMQTKTSTYTLK